ncbi:amidase [Mycobacterium tuberculosis]|nr:amidase [Mycobacterium tuberculosis]
MAMSAKASDDIAWLPATAQLAVLAAKKVSSAELVELYLSRIDTYNASLNAIVTVDPDAARRVAKRSDAARARGDELGPLHGLPITVKDSYETAGMRTTCGRRDLADYVPTQDAEAVARLRRAGAIIMGKTNMPTGNQDVQASNPVFGRTNNPWDAARTSGGSAGGGGGARHRGRADQLRLRLGDRRLYQDPGSLLRSVRPQIDLALGSSGRAHSQRTR